jgi:hypothetical protein
MSPNREDLRRRRPTRFLFIFLISTAPNHQIEGRLEHILFNRQYRLLSLDTLFELEVEFKRPTFAFQARSECLLSIELLVRIQPALNM